MKIQEKIKDVQSSFQRYFLSHSPKIRNFRPKLKLLIYKDRFLIKTAENFKELEQVLHLRYEVFYREWMDKKKGIELDLDKYDNICDHLMVIDRKIGKCIGTYRVNSSLYNDHFYSEIEFGMDNILKLSGNKLELGRACIDGNYRNGLTISLLWSGLSDYIKATKTQYLIGCTSIKTTDFYQITSIYKYLRDIYYSDEHIRVYPKKKYQVIKALNPNKGLNNYIDFLDQLNIQNYDLNTIKNMIPSLIKSYLKAGAVICGEPALDKEFQCIDFLTFLDINNMKDTFKKRFEVC